MIGHSFDPARELRAALVAAACLLPASIWFSGLSLAGGQTAADTALTVVQDNAAPLCAAYGPGFIVVGADYCAKVGGSVVAYGYKEFTDKDVSLVGQRIPTPFSSGAGVPIAYYFLEDISNKTRDPGFGAVASADLLVKRPTDYGNLTSFMRVTLDGNSTYDENGNLLVGFREIDRSFYVGALDQAWVQLDGLKIGVQQSLFGFNRLPSVVTPGYTSIVSTPAISYTWGVANNTSLSLSAEDGGRRLFGDGV